MEWMIKKGIMDKFHLRSFSLHLSACNEFEASHPAIQLVNLNHWWKAGVN
jgi:hypothetical protein